MISTFSLSKMQLNGVFLMLSFLANSQVKFNRTGTCPTPPTPSSVFEGQLIENEHYKAGLHYNSEKDQQHIFGSSGAINELNCITFSIDSVKELKVNIQDCAIYDGYLTRTPRNDYNLTLVNIDNESPCKNQTKKIENLSIWRDDSKDFIVLWSCLNDTKLTSHHQMALVFVANMKTNPDFKGNVDQQIFVEMNRFAEETLKFAGISLADMDKNEKLKKTGSCDFIGCAASPNCQVKVEEQGDFAGPLILFIVICFLILIVCLAFL